MEARSGHGRLRLRKPQTGGSLISWRSYLEPHSFRAALQALRRHVVGRPCQRGGCMRADGHSLRVC